jgi:hypothetical protein
MNRVCEELLRTERQMTDKTWVIEMDNGAINWTPIAYSIHAYPVVTHGR